MKIRALIIAREPKVRERIKSALRHEAAIEIVDECADESEATAAVQRWQPDLIFSAPEGPEGPDGLAARKYPERVVVKLAKRVFFLKTAEIEWVQAEDNYVRLHFQGQTCLLREKMKDLEAGLDPRKFARIHRSTIVNLECVKEMQPRPKGEFTVLLSDGTQLVLSRSYRDKFFALFEQWS